MRLYGLIAYGSMSKNPKITRDIDLIHLRLQMKNLPAPLRKYKTQNSWDLATPLFRVSERLLRLPRNSIKFNFGIEKYKTSLVTDPATEDIRAWKSIEGETCFVRIKDLLEHMKADKTIPGSPEAICQAYVLTFLGVLIALGQRFYLNGLGAQPAVEVDEPQVIRKIFSLSRLQGSVEKGTSDSRLRKLQVYAYDITDAFTSSYDLLLQDPPTVDTKQFVASVNQVTALLKTITHDK